MYLFYFYTFQQKEKILTDKRLKGWFGYELIIADFIILIVNQLIGRHLRLIRLIHEPMLKVRNKLYSLVIFTFFLYFFLCPYFFRIIIFPFVRVGKGLR